MIDPRLLDAVGDFLLSRLSDSRPALIGIAGSQGSGKSTLAKALARTLGGVSLSLDDVYLTRAQRRVLAADIHPLFMTRGPPLTHDLALLDHVLDGLMASDENSRTPLPCFDKLADDREPEDRWPVYVGRPRLIILEGWCLGARSQPAESLIAPVNEVEAQQDADLVWRRAINKALDGPYAQLTARLDGMVFLRAPSFDKVLDWRSQQEAGLMGIGHIDPRRRSELSNFIAKFERLSRWMMAGGIEADLTVELDENRCVLALTYAEPISET